MDRIFYAYFTAGKVGKTGLPVTIDVDRVALADGARTAPVSATAVTEARNGVYYYRMAGVDLSLYDYVAVFKTTDATVDFQQVAALQSDAGTAPTAAQVRAEIDTNSAKLDAAITSRLAASTYAAPDNAASIASAVWGAATRTLTAISDSTGIATLLARIGSALNIADGKVNVNDKTGFSLATPPPTVAEIAAAVNLDAGADPMMNTASGYPTNTLGWIIAKLATATPVFRSQQEPGKVALVYDDDYTSAEGRALHFSAPSGINLAGAMIKLQYDGGNELDGETDSASTCHVDVPRNTFVGGGVYKYRVYAILPASGNHATLEMGELRVIKAV